MDTAKAVKACLATLRGIYGARFEMNELTESAWAMVLRGIEPAEIAAACMRILSQNPQHPPTALDIAAESRKPVRDRLAAPGGARDADRKATAEERASWARREQERNQAAQKPKPIPHPRELRFEVWRGRLVRHYEACAKRDGYSTWFDWWEANNIRRGFAAHVRECVDQFGTGTAIAAGEELPAGSIGKTLSRTIPRR